MAAVHVPILAHPWRRRACHGSLPIPGQEARRVGSSCSLLTHLPTSSSRLTDHPHFCAVQSSTGVTRETVVRSSSCQAGLLQKLHRIIHSLWRTAPMPPPGYSFHSTRNPSAYPWELSRYSAAYRDHTKALFEVFRWPRRHTDMMHEIFREFGDYLFGRVGREAKLEVRRWCLTEERTPQRGLERSADGGRDGSTLLLVRTETDYYSIIITPHSSSPTSQQPLAPHPLQTHPPPSPSPSPKPPAAPNPPPHPHNPR